METESLIEKIRRPTESGIRIDVVKDKYLGEFPILIAGGNITDAAYPLFYELNPDFTKGHSHYYSLFVRDGHVYITGNPQIETLIFRGIEKDNKIIYSAHRYDYQTVPGTSEFIDGGAWTGITGTPYQAMCNRATLSSKFVSFCVKDGDVVRSMI